MSAADITLEIKNQMRDLKEKTDQFKAKYSRSTESSPTRTPQRAKLEQSMTTATPDLSYNIFDDVKSPNHDRMSGLQESLSENKARLAAILGVGMALEKTYRRSVTPEPHVRFSRSTSDADKKDQRLSFDQPNQENSQVNLRLAEVSKQLADKSKDFDKVNAELQRVTALLSTKSNNLTVVEAHVNAVEALVNSLVSIDNGEKQSKSPSTHVAGKLLDSDLVSPQSTRFISMISNLSLVKSNNVRRAEDLNNAQRTIEELRKEVYQKQLALSQQQTQASNSKSDEVKDLKQQLEQAVVASTKRQADHAK